MAVKLGAHLGQQNLPMLEIAELARTGDLSVQLALDERGAARAESELRAMWGPAAERMISGALIGTPARAREALDAYLDEVVPAVRARAG